MKLERQIGLRVMNWIRAHVPILIAFLCMGFNAPIYVFVATSGDDANDCLSAATPCRTIQAGVQKIPMGGRGNVYIAAGAYTASVDVHYHRSVGIFGPYDGQRCIDPNQVVIDALPGEPAFWVQDNAIGHIGCLKIRSAYVGFSGRQFSVTDFSDIVFDDVVTPVMQSDLAIANCGARIWINGSGSAFATVNHSQLNVGCNITIAPGVAYDAFFIAGSKSVIFTGSMTYTGSITGKKWIIDNSEIGPNCSVPGTGVRETRYAVAPEGC